MKPINYKSIFVITLILSIFMFSLVSSGIINPSSLGYAGRTYATNYEIWVQSFNTVNITPMQVINGQNYSLPPWYIASNICDMSNSTQFNQGCSIGTENATNYCMATDEISQWAVTLSMSQNASNEPEVIGMLNTIDALNVSATNSLTEWKSSYQSGVINKSEVADSASDADARFILFLANTYNSNVYSSSTKTRAGTKLSEMCEDYSNNNFLKISRTSAANSSITIDTWGCGGTNVCTDLTNNDFMYSGYYGDNAMALGVCGIRTGNNTYFEMATDLTENFFAAANWTNNSQLRFPPGRSFKWNNAGVGQTPWASDTSGVAYIDTPDAKRFTSICTAGYMFNLSGRTLHPRLPIYCNLIRINLAGYGLTNYSHEWWSNGTIHSTAEDAYSNNGLAMQIDMLANQSNVQERLDYIWDNKWDDTQKDFFIGCQGLYDPSFPVHSMGYSLGYMEEAFGLGNEEIGNDVISIILREPLNNSIIYNTSALTDVLLRVTVTNNNITDVTNTTFDTVPKVYSNCTFDSNDCGWTGASQVSGTDGYFNLSTNSFSPTQNMSRYKNSSTFFVEQVYRFELGKSIGNFKFYPLTAVGELGNNDRFYLENSTSCGFVMKHEPTFTQVGSTIGCFSNVTLTIKLNVTGNTRVMLANFSWSNGTATNGDQGTWMGWSADQNTTYTTNANGTGIEINGNFIGIPRLYNQHLLNRGVNASYTTTTPGNSSMNVSFYNASNGALIGTRTNVSSGGDANITWSNLPLGNYSWYVNVTSENNRVKSSIVTFSIQSNASSGGGGGSTNQTNLGSFCAVITLGVPNFFSGLTAVFTIFAVLIIIGFLFLVFTAVEGKERIDWTEVDAIKQTINFKVVLGAILGITMLGWLFITIIGALCQT